MRLRRWAALLLSLMIFLPVLAASTRFDLLASAQQSATGNGGAISVSGIKEMVVYVAVTAKSGTTPVLDLWLQGSSDGGTTWFDLTHESSLTDASSSATEGAVQTNKRDIVPGLSDALGSFSAKYSIFGDFVRVRWVLSGTGGPTYTFSVKAVGK